MDNNSKPASRPRLQWDLLVGILPLLAMSPMLIYQLAGLWSRSSMQFFPWVLALVGILVALRFSASREVLRPSRLWTAIGLFVLTVLIYVYSVWEFSPWLAHLAAVLAFTAWALGRFGQMHWASVLAWTTLLLTTLPLPWGWDQLFNDWLQTAAAWTTTKALDALAIPCLQNGGLLETRSLTLVADEICGGLGSVYAFWAFGIAICLLQHRSFVVGLKTWFLVPVWTLLGFFLRLFGIVIAQEVWGRDLSSGWDFLLIEIATAAIVLLLIWTTTRFFTRIFEPIPVADAEFGPVFSGLNKFCCWPQPDPFEELEPEDTYERQRFQKQKSEKEARQNAFKPLLWAQHPAAKWLVRGAAMVSVVAGLLPLRSLASQGFANLNFGRPQYSMTQLKSLADENSLPVELAEAWKRVGFDAVRRSPRSRRGEFGLVWHYRAGEQQFDAILDLPLIGWSDPAAELASRGWKVTQDSVELGDPWPWVQAELENELGGKAYLFYSLFTPAAEPFTVVPRPLLDNPLEAAPRDQDKADAETNQSSTAVTYLFQLFSETGAELPLEEREALQAKFLELRQLALALPTK